MHHELKTWPRYFDAVKRGDKSFEVRRDDRGYAVGDTLVLREFEPDAPGDQGLTSRFLALRAKGSCTGTRKC